MSDVGFEPLVNSSHTGFQIPPVLEVIAWTSPVFWEHIFSNTAAPVSFFFSKAAVVLSLQRDRDHSPSPTSIPLPLTYFPDSCCLISLWAAFSSVQDHLCAIFIHIALTSYLLMSMEVILPSCHSTFLPFWSHKMEKIFISWFLQKTSVITFAFG